MSEKSKWWLSYGRLFSGGSTRIRLLQWTAFLIITLVLYILFYQATELRILMTKFLASGNTNSLSLKQFRDLIAKSKKNSLSDFLFFHKKNYACPVISPKLVGPINVNTDILSYKQIEDKNPDLELGGHYSPTNCKARQNVAILVPYRDRQAHLKIFLQNIHPFLQKQQIDYTIYIVEMVSGVKFNRAMLFNIGYVEASKLYNHTCFIFHDVDLVPENDLNLYSCSEDHPRHMSVAIDKMHYKLPYNQIFGGASAMTKDQFELVNGFSNLYFGWGGEDDDMYNRIVYNKMNIIRFSSAVARYKMLSHAKDSPNPVRVNLLKQSDLRFKTDGLNSLEYDVLKILKHQLYTWILVKVDEAEFEDDHSMDWIVLVVVLIWLIVICFQFRKYIYFTFDTNKNGYNHFGQESNLQLRKL